jgi:hypothetical protein
MQMSAKPFKFAWTHHIDYFKIVRDNYTRIQKLKREHDEYLRSIKGRKMSEHDIDFLASKNDAIGELALIVIVFSAFTLEAYINHYGISRLSKNYFSNYLDKLDLLAKWLVIPRLVTGKKLDPGSQAIQNLSWLVALRNRLAHFKSKIITVREIKESDLLWHEDAERALTTVKGVVSLLKRIDVKAETDWIGQNN